MRLSKSLKNTLFTILLPILVTGCASNLLDLFQQTRLENAYRKANTFVLEDKPATAAKHLWEFAHKLPSPYQQEMQIQAANILLDANHPLGAYRYLLQISESEIESIYLLKKRIAEARFYRQTYQPERTITALPLELINQGDKKTKIIALELSANALMLTDEFVKGINRYVMLSKLLNKQQRQKNIATLSESLLYLDPQQVKEELFKNPSNAVRPWLEFAMLATPFEMNRTLLEQQYATWKKRNKRWTLPDTIDQTLRTRWGYLDYHPKKIALLLPLTGNYAKAGKAVKNGFIEANQQSATSAMFTIVIHNTDQSTGITNIYEKAIADDDVDLVIGPLLKAKVNKLLADGDIRIPTISLNYATTNTPITNSNVFQFGLLPEDEAVQAARKIWRDGHHFIVALTPKDAWGKRLYRAFEAEFTALGGTIRATSHYDPSFVDYAVVIKSLFQLNQSHERHRLVSVALGEKPRFKPRIRDDISASMLFADPHHAVMIFPQMKFHYVNKIPTYATSHVYNPKIHKGGRDLNDLIYCDIPAIIERGKFTDKKIGEYIRLYALGADAQKLITRFRHMQITRFSLNGQTGKITIEENQHLFRKLPWAKFSHGIPIPLDVM